MARTFRMSDGDLEFDVNGRLTLLEGAEKVQQDIAEALLTDYDRTRDFGSRLNALTYNPSMNASEGQISTYISDAIDRLRAMQRTNPTTTRQEEIAMVDGIQVFKNDQTEVLFGVSVITTEGQGANTTIMLAPNPVKLNHLLPPSVTEQNQQTIIAALKTERS